MPKRIYRQDGGTWVEVPAGDAEEKKPEVLDAALRLLDRQRAQDERDAHPGTYI